MAEKAFVVTTEKGVFFGYGAANLTDTTIKLSRARMVVYWAKDCKSVVGLASVGPNKACRISPAAPSIIVPNITAIIECSDEAATKFEEAPWSK